MIFGSHVYYDYIRNYIKDTIAERNDLYINQMRTNIDDDKTDEAIDIGRVSFSYGYRTNRVIVDSSFYIKRSIDSNDPFLEKYSQDGSSIRINFSAIGNIMALSDTSMVYLDDMLYIPAREGLVALDPKDDSFSYIELGESLVIEEMVGVGDALYFLARNNYTYESQIWSYNAKTEQNASLLYTFDANTLPPYNSSIHVHGTKIFLKYDLDFGEHFLLSLDTISGNIAFLPKPGILLHRARSYKGFLYYSTQDHTNTLILWKSDGTVIGTQKVLDTEGNTIKPRNLTVLHDKLFFANRDDEHGEELWVSDGVEPRMLLDVATGTTSSSPRHMTKLNDGIVFQASKDGISNHLYYYHDGILDLLK
ncbi:MAG: hypothetical protein HF962_08790 [Sulfurovum sp.]|nr:hypothetical protein [Sulfurovum sp.]